jgi:polysaccharide pyruvyl transferase WcaK-like protein
MDSQSLNPQDFTKLLAEARKSDLIFWGGGELLKDYTNKTALWYWIIKMWAVSIANKNLYGAFQGIGPTKANSSKRLICFVVNRCLKFSVRDNESAEKLITWGCDKDKIIASSDPAILPEANRLTNEDRKMLEEKYALNENFIKNFVCIGPRDWFHYKHGGLIPYRYKKAFKSLFGIKDQNKPNPKHDKYLESLISLADNILKDEYSILFVPMHMGEEDIKLCEYIQKNSSDPDRIRILNEDTVPPALLRSIMSNAKLMIGFRLHSTIIATSSAVPSINYYYVDKGRVYFDQIGQSKNSFPIEKLLEDNSIKDFDKTFKLITDNKQDVSNDISRRIASMRTNIKDAFDRLVNIHD